MKKFLKRMLIFIFIVVVLAGAFYAYSSYRQTQQAQAAAASIETAVLAKGSLSSTISATGMVRSGQNASLNWKTSGIVEKVNVALGDKVKAGDVLANLSQTSLAQNVITAQSDLANAQSALDDLATSAETNKVKAMQNIVTNEGNVRDAQYQLDNFTVPSDQTGMTAVEAVAVMKQRLDAARTAFEPYKYSSSNDSTRKDLKDALDKAQASYDAAVKRLKLEYNLEVAQANLDSALHDYDQWKNGPNPIDVASAKAKIAAAQATLTQAWVEAPFDGTITLVGPLVGDQVSNSDVAFRIDNLSEMDVDMQVSEVDISQIKIGQDSTIKFDALRSKVYHGKVSDVAMVGDLSGNAVNFTVTVKLTDPDKDVRPGMTAAVDIITATRDGALLIPNQAIFVENGQRVIYLQKPGQGIVRLEITVGISSDTYSELLTGDVQAGDDIVLTPPSKTYQLPTRFGGMFGGGPRETQPSGQNNGQPSGGPTP